MSDDPLTECEVCGGQVSKVLFAPAIHFKGTGFHNTDYGTKRRGAADDSGSGDGAASKNGSSGGDGKAAEKPAAASSGSSGGKTVGLDKV
jgi:predicted nucleic acid-binding Zn ribbon protein